MSQPAITGRPGPRYTRLGTHMQKGTWTHMCTNTHPSSPAQARQFTGSPDSTQHRHPLLPSTCVSRLPQPPMQHLPWESQSRKVGDRSPAMDTDRPPGLRPQEPNAARELRRRTVRASPIESLGLRAPAWVGGGGGVVCARRSRRLAAIRGIAPGTARPGAWQEVVHSRWGAYCMPRLLPLC